MEGVGAGTEVPWLAPLMKPLANRDRSPGCGRQCGERCFVNPHRCAGSGLHYKVFNAGVGKVGWVSIHVGKLSEI